MNNHNLKGLKSHVWETSDKINVYSKKDINKGDIITDGDTAYNVLSVVDKKRPNPDSDLGPGFMFYELNVSK